MDIQQKQSDTAKATLAAFDFETKSDMAEHREEILSPIQAAVNTLQPRHTMAERPCDDCRSRKKRCDRNRPQCGACVKRKITCHYSEPPRPLKRKRTASESSNQTTTSAEVSRDGDVELLHEEKETSPSTRFNSPEAEGVAGTKETDYGLDEEQVAQMPYWKWMERRKAFDADMERASEKLREQEVGRARKDSVIEDDSDDQQIPKDVDGTKPQEAAERAVPLERTAAQQVFGIYELLERILLEADMKTVLLAQRIDKTFQHVIDRSTGLQQKLFFKSCPYTTWLANPLFMPNNQRGLRDDQFRVIALGEDKVFDIPSTFSRKHEDESWRRMLVFQPIIGANKRPIRSYVYDHRSSLSGPGLSPEMRMVAIWYMLG